LAALLVAAEAAPTAPPAQGFCSYLAWITLNPGERLTIERGPDFLVYRVNGPGDTWRGVYSGNFAQVSGNGRLLTTRYGVTVKADQTNGKFDGYLASDRKGSQNHFFGSVFKGDDSDFDFFRRVDFGPVGQEKCQRSYRDHA
jgi:hypothetical protein